MTGGIRFDQVFEPEVVFVTDNFIVLGIRAGVDPEEALGAARRLYEAMQYDGGMVVDVINTQVRPVEIRRVP